MIENKGKNQRYDRRSPNQKHIKHDLLKMIEIEKRAKKEPHQSVQCMEETLKIRFKLCVTFNCIIIGDLIHCLGFFRIFRILWWSMLFSLKWYDGWTIYTYKPKRKSFWLIRMDVDPRGVRSPSRADQDCISSLVFFFFFILPCFFVLPYFIFPVVYLCILYVFQWEILLLSDKWQVFSSWLYNYAF